MLTSIKTQQNVTSASVVSNLISDVTKVMTLQKHQEFIIDFGNVEITNSYLPDNYKPSYKVQCFQISFTKAFIFTSSESYKLSNEFDGTIRIYMLDGINEYSISYIQIDWLLSEINITLRLIDYINIMYCFYYNIYL